MRTSPASSLAPHRRGFIVAAVAALLLALAAVPALAQDAGDDPDAGGVCTPELVTHTPDGTTGVEEAVAITSQAIDRGVDGWISVSWQVADGAELTGLTVTELDGSVSTLTTDIDSGSLFDVAGLRFCGTYDGEVSVQPEPPVEEDDGTDDGTDDGADSGAGDDAAADDGDADDGSTGGGTDDSTGGSGGDDGAGSAGGSGDDGGSDPSDTGDAGTDDGDSSDTDGSGEGGEQEAVTVPPPDEELDLGEEATVESAETDEPDTAEDAAGDDAAEADTEDDTEVLGVQLTRDDPEPGGGMSAWLLAASIVLLGLVGYGAFRLRHAIR